MAFEMICTLTEVETESFKVNLLRNGGPSEMKVTLTDIPDFRPVLSSLTVHDDFSNELGIISRHYLELVIPVSRHTTVSNDRELWM
jgi:hypothetical protein